MDKRAPGYKDSITKSSLADHRQREPRGDRPNGGSTWQARYIVGGINGMVVYRLYPLVVSAKVDSNKRLKRHEWRKE